MQSARRGYRSRGRREDTRHHENVMSSEAPTEKLTRLASQEGRPGGPCSNPLHTQTRPPAPPTVCLSLTFVWPVGYPGCPAHRWPLVFRKYRLVDDPTSRGRYSCCSVNATCQVPAETGEENKSNKRIAAPDLSFTTRLDLFRSLVNSLGYNTLYSGLYLSAI